MDLLLFALQTGLAYGLAGVAVRITLTVTGSFNFFVAIAAVLSAELGIVIGNAGAVESFFGTFIAAFAGVMIAAVAGYLWSHVGSLTKTSQSASQLTVFVGSLGALMFVIGFTGVMRGPGLRTIEGIAGKSVGFFGSYVGISVIVGVAVTGLIIIGSFLWLRMREGYSLRLYAMNPYLSKEIGIDENKLRRSGTIFAGVCAGAAGCSLAFSGGSTPEIGMKIFLFGAGAALLFESRELLVPLLAGLILGLMQVGIQLILAPAWSESVMFALVILVLLWRRSSREAGDLR